MPQFPKNLKPYLVALVVITAAGCDTPTTVDITFSLECRQLESNWDQTIALPYDTAVTDFEKAKAELDAAQSTFDALSRYQALTGVEYYSTGVRLAFNHGLPDGHV